MKPPASPAAIPSPSAQVSDDGTPDEQTTDAIALAPPVAVNTLASNTMHSDLAGPAQTPAAVAVTTQLNMAAAPPAQPPPAASPVASVAAAPAPASAPATTAKAVAAPAPMTPLSVMPVPAPAPTPLEEAPASAEAAATPLPDGKEQTLLPPGQTQEIDDSSVNLMPKHYRHGRAVRPGKSHTGAIIGAVVVLLLASVVGAVGYYVWTNPNVQTYLLHH